MICKEIVTKYLKAHKFDGLCNPEVPCGCLLNDLAPCGGDMLDCHPGHRKDVDDNTICGCDAQGTKHWHVCIDEPEEDRWRKHFEEAKEWLCDCGERCNSFDVRWRWNGHGWEHFHGYPLGHVMATRTPEVKRGQGMKRYIVFERPQGSKCWTLAQQPKDCGDSTEWFPAEFHRRSTAENFVADDVCHRRGWLAGIPNQTPMTAHIAEVELPE